jgi:hypothetical protein
MIKKTDQWGPSQKTALMIWHERISWLRFVIPPLLRLTSRQIKIVHKSSNYRSDSIYYNTEWNLEMYTILQQHCWRNERYRNENSLYFGIFVTSVALHVSHLYSSSVLTFVGRDGVIGIATRYGPDGPTIESRWRGRDFSYPSKPALRPTQPHTQ